MGALGYFATLVGVGGRVGDRGAVDHEASTTRLSMPAIRMLTVYVEIVVGVWYNESVEKDLGPL